MKWVRCIAVIAALAVLSGCPGKDGNKESSGGRTGEVALGDEASSKVFEADVNVEVAGAVTTQWSGSTPLNVARVTGYNSPKQLWQLTVGILPEDLIDIDGMKLRSAFDLIGYHGNGRYRIKPAVEVSQDDLAKAGENIDSLGNTNAVQSTAFVMVQEPGEEAPRTFNKIAKPCSVRIRELGHSGVLRCSQLSDGSEDVVLTMTWNVTKKKAIRDLMDLALSATTTTPSGEGQAATTTATSGEGTTEPGGEGGGTDGKKPGDKGFTYGMKADFPLDVSVEPQPCATRGTKATVTIDTLPNAKVTLVGVYSDGQHHEATFIGAIPPTGKLVWPFVVGPDAPNGEMGILVNVTDENHSGGGFARAFTVKDEC